MGLTSRLVEFVISTSFSDLSGDVIEKSKQMMLNAAAIGLAGSTEMEGRVILEYVDQMGGQPECTILGSNIRSSPANAALANGTMIHVLDYDESVLRRGNHPSSIIFPVVTSLGEQKAMPGTDVLSAFAIGCEVSTKIGAAGDRDEMEPRMVSYGWHPIAVAGSIGATAAAGKLLGLDKGQMENALGIVLALVSGANVTRGTSAKSLMCGHAAMNGIMAAVLAMKGFTGPRDAMEAEDSNGVGFFGLFRRDARVDEDDFIRHLGNPYDVIDPGVAFKLYPCNNNAQAAVDAALYLRHEHHISADEVQSVQVSVPADMVEYFPQPDTGLQAKFSIGYCVALALVHGQPQIHHFTDNAVKDPQVRVVLNRVHVKTNELATREVFRPCTVAIGLTDGRTLTHHVKDRKGHPANPLTTEELNSKFEYCSHEILSSADIASAIFSFRTLETLKNVRPLFSILGNNKGSYRE